MLENWITINKRDATKILNRLQKITKINPKITGFSIRSIKNNRGDYGYCDLYFYQGNLYFVLDVDGARQDVRYHKLPDTDSILGEIEKDCKGK
jgi:hypothetical protein